MDKIFQTEPISFLSRLYNGFIKTFILIWIICLTIFLIVIKNVDFVIIFSTLFGLTIIFALGKIPKIRYFLISIDYDNDNIKVKFMDYENIKDELIALDDINVELKYAWERRITRKLIFTKKGKFLFNIFASNNLDTNNERLNLIFDKIIELKKNGKAAYNPL